MSFEQTKHFNGSCSCATINREKLEQIQKMVGGNDEGSFDFQKYFSSSPTSLSKLSLQKIEVFLKSLRIVLENKEIFNHLLNDMGSRFYQVLPGEVTGGLFLGFDFHDTETGPKLIEINTNAGGLLINSILYEVQEECCTLLYSKKEISDYSKMKDIVFQFFLNEWKIQFKDRKLRTVVILDDDPKNQFLYPEFKIFQKILLENKVSCFILSPEELRLVDDRLYYLEEKIDFIYNRHTDFLLHQPSMKPVSQAWASGNLCLSPNPIDYMLFANKANLQVLSDKEFLRKYGIDEDTIRVFAEMIPETHVVHESERDIYWEKRKKVFFKPLNSYGSRGVYAGRKITKSKFDEILKLDYLAQEEVPPTTRTINSTDFKIDYRAYVYNFDLLMLASRLYKGQTTNFRTEGGGFSAVMEVG
jgi:hypothetical protein